MAEYIEREALLSELQEEIDFETSMYTEEQNKYFNMGLKCAVRDVKSQPTADVVPRSEVENIFAEIETCMKDFEDDDDGYLLKKCEFEFFMREIKEKYAVQKNG